MVFSKGQRFTIREGKMTLGSGMLEPLIKKKINIEIIIINSNGVHFTGIVTDVKPNLSEDERMLVLGGKKARDKKERQDAIKAAKLAAKRTR